MVKEKMSECCSLFAVNPANEEQLPLSIGAFVVDSRRNYYIIHGHRASDELRPIYEPAYSSILNVHSVESAGYRQATAAIARHYSCYSALL